MRRGRSFSSVCERGFLPAWGLLLSGGVLLLCALAIGGCGEGKKSASNSKVSARGSTLTIYSSLPFRGESRQQAEDVLAGERFALEEVGSKIGRFHIQLRSLDDATAESGKWDEKATSANAQMAADDPTAVAYIGDFNSAATAISLPILNSAGVLQVSPASSYVGLTQSINGFPGEPDKYYPARKQTFARLVPPDTVQAAAQVALMKRSHCNSLFILHDRETYGSGIATQVARSATAAGMKVVENRGIDLGAPSYAAAGEQIKAAAADCFFYGGITANRAVSVFSDVSKPNPELHLFAPDGLANPAFAGRLGQRTAKRLLITGPPLNFSKLTREGASFYARFKRKYGMQPDPYAIYGYESAKSILEAIRRAGPNGNDRDAVVAEYFKTRRHDSAIGRYSIGAAGDSSVRAAALYRVTQGQLQFDRLITPRHIQKAAKKPQV